MIHDGKRRLFILLAATVLAVAVLGAPAAAHGPAPWQARAMYWAPAPVDVDAHGFALRLETGGAPVLTGSHGSLSVSPARGTSVPDLEALAFDAFVESGGCGGGSPRMNVRIDADGDGSTDGAVQVYPVPTACPTGGWAHVDLLAAGASSWQLNAFGKGRSTPDEASGFLATTYPNHQVTRVDLQWDDVPRTGAGVVWFDNVHVHSHTLAEPVGTEVTCPMLPDGTGACPFHLVPQDVVNGPAPHPTWPYAH